MKEIFVQYASYNVWATNSLLDVIRALPEEKLHLPINSSFPSIFKTLLHLLDAESIWWQRMNLKERIDKPSDGFTGDMIALGTAIQKQNKLWSDWVTAANENKLQHEFFYHDSRGERHKSPVYQVLLHLLNHGTYHRGQLITMLRQVGVEKLPCTDFIAWARK